MGTSTSIERIGNRMFMGAGFNANREFRVVDGEIQIIKSYDFDAMTLANQTDTDFNALFNKATGGFSVTDSGSQLIVTGMTDTNYNVTYDRATVFGTVDVLGTTFTEDTNYRVYVHDAGGGTYYVAVFNGIAWYCYTTTTDPNTWTDSGATGNGSGEILTASSEDRDGKNGPSSVGASVDYQNSFTVNADADKAFFSKSGDNTRGVVYDSTNNRMIMVEDADYDFSTPENGDTLTPDVTVVQLESGAGTRYNGFFRPTESAIVDSGDGDVSYAFTSNKLTTSSNPDFNADGDMLADRATMLAFAESMISGDMHVMYSWAYDDSGETALSLPNNKRLYEIEGAVDAAVNPTTGGSASIICGITGEPEKFLRSNPKDLDPEIATGIRPYTSRFDYTNTSGSAQDILVTVNAVGASQGAGRLYFSYR